MSTRERVLRVVSEVLGRPVASIDDDSSPDNIESWDSLKQMNLVLALEQEFGIRFTDERIVEMLSVRLIVAAVAQLGPQANSDSER
jgi:acyl carrier protein